MKETPYITKTAFAKSAFLLCGKTGCSGRKSNGTVLFTEIFFGKKEYFQRYSSFLGVTGIYRNTSVPFALSY